MLQRQSSLRKAVQDVETTVIRATSVFDIGSQG